MKVGIIGSGDVGQRLGEGFATTGHEVKIGSREPSSEKLAKWKATVGSRGSAGTFADAAQFGELAVVATLWSGTESAIRLAGAANLEGKVVIDATNPLAFRADGPPGLAVGHTDSAGESIQRWLPKSRVVKAFNIVGNADMFRPKFPGGPPDMFYCGNDASAKKVVSGIIGSFGWNPVDIGGIEGARVLEPLCILWVGYMFTTGSRRHALKMLHH